MSDNLRRNFNNREELISYLIEEFPEASENDKQVSDVKGGRSAAEQALKKINPARYEKSRNFLNGAVTRLSPYIRHGVLNLAEVRDQALALVVRQQEAAKLINELGWRDYWQRLYAKFGDGIWKDQEDYKTGFKASDYEDAMPDDVAAASTGLACIDAFSNQLQQTGYLHNHARMWMAAYVVHWRRTKWQAGARWFLRHLLDGDPASNNLSWQWVASTFSHKPYFFNRDNLEKYTEGKYCKQCPMKAQCDFDGDYAEIAAKLFPKAMTDFSR